MAEDTMTFLSTAAEKLREAQDYLAEGRTRAAVRRLGSAAWNIKKSVKVSEDQGTRSNPRRGGNDRQEAARILTVAKSSIDPLPALLRLLDPNDPLAPTWELMPDHETTIQSTVVRMVDQIHEEGLIPEPSWEEKTNLADAVVESRVLPPQLIQLWEQMKQARQERVAEYRRRREEGKLPEERPRYKGVPKPKEKGRFVGQIHGYREVLQPDGRKVTYTEKVTVRQRRAELKGALERIRAEGDKEAADRVRKALDKLKGKPAASMVKVKRTRLIQSKVATSAWIWNGREWVTIEEWEQRGVQLPAGTRFEDMPPQPRKKRTARAPKKRASAQDRAAARRERDLQRLRRGRSTGVHPGMRAFRTGRGMLDGDTSHMLLQIAERVEELRSGLKQGLYTGEYVYDEVSDILVVLDGILA